MRITDKNTLFLIRRNYETDREVLRMKKEQGKKVSDYIFDITTVSCIFYEWT